MQEFDSVLKFLEKRMKIYPRYAQWHLRAMVVLGLAMYAGLRRSEAEHLRWEDVDFEQREIWIRITDAFKTKTGRERTVPMISRLEHLLNRLPQEGDYVLSGSDSPISHGYGTGVWKRIRKDIEPPIQISYHGLRHSFATWLSSQPGVSLKTVSEVLGHSDISTTMIYAHVQKSDLDRLKDL